LKKYKNFENLKMITKYGKKGCDSDEESDGVLDLEEVEKLV